MDKYTAEQVRHCAKYIKPGSHLAYGGMHEDAANMLEAYANHLESAQDVQPIGLDVIGQAIEERNAAIAERDQLASQMIYRGNSVSWWHSKATSYRDAIGKCWDALKEAGINADGHTTVVDAIRKLATEQHAKDVQMDVVRLKFACRALRELDSETLERLRIFDTGGSFFEDLDAAIASKEKDHG